MEWTSNIKRNINEGKTMKFQNADDEFSGIAKELYLKHKETLNLTVDPSRVMFLRVEKKKGKYAWCKLIHGEYEHLTNKKFFIVIVSENFDQLNTEEKKKYVILHELKHLSYDDEKDKFRLFRHDLEEFQELLINPNWNLQILKNDKKE